MKRPKRGRPLTIADMLNAEARIPPERGGPFRNVRRALDGTSADNPRLRRILAEELTVFAATAVQKGQQRDQAGTDNLARHSEEQSRKADAIALEAVKAWCDEPARRRRCSVLSLADNVRKYLKLASPPRRQGARLRAMLKADRLK